MELNNKFTINKRFHTSINLLDSVDFSKLKPVGLLVSLSTVNLSFAREKLNEPPSKRLCLEK
jgi:hypothetical protein